MNFFPVIQQLSSIKEYQVDVLRLDLIDEEVSGNKWFKLKYNIEAAKKSQSEQIITFGGAYSNHLAATAAACKKLNFKCIGVVRGEEQLPLNPTLLKAKQNGMILHFVSRELYNKKTEQETLLYLKNTFGTYYLVPEGGNNEAGILGCKEIIKPEWNHDYIFCACGTGATYTGILASVKPHQKVIGVSVLKGVNTMVEDVNTIHKKMYPDSSMKIRGNEELEKAEIKEHCISNNYAFNGYAKLNRELIEFKQTFEADFNIMLDYVYTNKLVYAVFDLIKKSKLRKKSNVLIIHSGGLQGNKGFEERYHLIPRR